MGIFTPCGFRVRKKGSPRMTKMGDVAGPTAECASGARRTQHREPTGEKNKRHTVRAVLVWSHWWSWGWMMAALAGI